MLCPLILPHTQPGAAEEGQRAGLCTHVGSRTLPFGPEHAATLIPSQAQVSFWPRPLRLAPGSCGHSRDLTRVQKACLRFGREAGWGLSTPFLLLFSQGIKFQSQQLRGKGLESKLPLKVSSVVPKSTCVWFSVCNLAQPFPASQSVRTLAQLEGDHNASVWASKQTRKFLGLSGMLTEINLFLKCNPKSPQN